MSGDRLVFDDVAVQTARLVGDGLVFAFGQDAGHRTWGRLAVEEALREGCVLGTTRCADGIELHATNARIEEERAADLERLTEEVGVETGEEDCAAFLRGIDE